MARKGRTPGGRVWREWQHPRDDRGRFAKHGGRKWLGRALTEANRAGRVSFGDVDMGSRPGEGPNGRLERGPGGLINLKGIQERGALATGGKRVPASKAWLYGDQVLTPGGFRDNTGRETKYNADTKAFETRTLWKDSAGREHGVVGDEVIVRRRPPADPGEALPRGSAEERRMEGWAADAAKPSPIRLSTAGIPTVREQRMADAERDLAEKQAALDEATRKARKRALRKYPNKEGYGNWTRDRFIDDATADEQRARNLAQNEVTYLQGGGTVHRGDDLAFSARPELIGDLDRSRPLAVYGDMLHAKAYDWASFRALSDLASIPAELHMIVAGAMVGKRDDGIMSEQGRKKVGIWVGNGGVDELIPGEPVNERPRGWREGSTFADVDGVFQPWAFALAVGHTDNTRADGHTAAEHEFGHALDFAIGNGNAGAASQSPEWTALHGRVLADHGPGLSPYFQQPGYAGAQEFWAEAFAVWARAYRRALSLDMGKPGSLDPEGFRANRTTVAMSSEFDLKDSAILADLHAYFLKISTNAGADWKAVT